MIEQICNFCADVFPIDIDLPAKTYIITRGGKEIWVCASCKEKLLGVV